VIAIDGTGIYWILVDDDTLKKANLDGTGLTTLFDPSTLMATPRLELTATLSSTTTTLTWG
jgi:hypothetical protein